MADDTPSQHMLTQYVFIDTEALRRARFDWNGKTLSRLTEFGRQGYLRLLITEVTKGEVTSQLREILAEAVACVKKHESVLLQIGATGALTVVANADAGIAALDAAFKKFLEDVKAIDVPLNADLGALFGDYFARRPPFSAKKKSEFPDAVTIASLLAWCKEKQATAYVVSADPDLKACCSSSGPLFHAESIADIISQATVSTELHAALEKAISESESLSDELADQIKSMELEHARGSMMSRSNHFSIAGKIDSVDGISVLSVSVLDQKDNNFTCEIEIEAELALKLTVEIEGGYYNYYEGGDYERPQFYTTNRSIYHAFYAEVIACFDRKAPENIEFESVHVSGNTVELRSRDIESVLSHRY